MLLAIGDDMHKNQNLMLWGLQDTQALASSSEVLYAENDSLEQGHPTQHPASNKGLLAQLFFVKGNKQVKLMWFPEGFRGINREL